MTFRKGSAMPLQGALQGARQGTCKAETPINPGLCKVPANPLQGGLQSLVGGSFRTPTNLAEKGRNGATNSGLDPRRWQPRTELRDDLPLLDVAPELQSIADDPEFASLRRLIGTQTVTLNGPDAKENG